MKAAFLFSGQVRGLTHCIEKLEEHLFSKFDISDKFFYLPIEDTELISVVLKTDPTCIVFEQDFYHHLEEKISPHNQISYSHHTLSANNYSLKGRMQHYFLQWYGVKRVYEMMESYCKNRETDYDVVIRIRCDTRPYTPLNLQEINLESINIPRFQHHYGMHDRFAIGNMKNMKIYCSKYDNLINENMGNMNSENRLLHHLLNHQMTINLINFEYDRINKDGSKQD